MSLPSLFTDDIILRSHKHLARRLLTNLHHIYTSRSNGNLNRCLLTATCCLLDHPSHNIVNDDALPANCCRLMAKNVYLCIP